MIPTKHPTVSLRRLKAARDTAGLSQEQAAHRLGVTRGAVQNWEHGHRVPRADVLAGMARLYGVPIESLFEHDHDGTPGHDGQGENTHDGPTPLPLPGDGLTGGGANGG